MTMRVGAICGAAPVTLLDGDSGEPDRRQAGPGSRAPGIRPGRTGWWRAWRQRFGLAELCGSAGAIAGFAAGYLPTGSLLTAAALATAGEVIGFYGCAGAKTVAAAARATAHLSGGRRLAAAGWHAIRDQLASCAAAEALDDFLIRPGCLAGGAWLLRSLPGGVWLGFAAGKAAADAAWYAMEASARWGVTRCAGLLGTAGGAAGRPLTPAGSVCAFPAGETGYAEERPDEPGPAGGGFPGGYRHAPPPAVSAAQ